MTLDRDPRTLAHTYGPETSKSAARGERSTHRARVLTAFQRGPLTSYQAWQALSADFDLTEVRRRCTDLKNIGMLAPTGATLPEQPIKAGDVLALTPEGRAHLGLSPDPKPEPEPPVSDDPQGALFS